MSPSLPPVTETGANTFGCKINGKVWVPYYPCTDINTGGTQIRYNIAPLNSNSILPIKFSLIAGNVNQYKYGPSFFNFIQGTSGGITGPGDIKDSLLISFNATTDPSGQGLEYDQSGSSSNSFQITKIDTVNGIVSGVFQFTMYAYTTPNAIADSISVTEGRFDVRIANYSYCSH
ncbi:MAG TPA: hypothetical protein VKR53_10520 [Puia sp.]|nr:hypothetical protein [Puia sp.]